MFFNKFKKRNRHNTKVIVNYNYVYEPEPEDGERPEVFPGLSSIMQDILLMMEKYKITYRQYEILIEELNLCVHRNRSSLEYSKSAEYHNDKLKYDVSDEIIKNNYALYRSIYG